jgi:hypothetical protein
VSLRRQQQQQQQWQSQSQYSLFSPDSDQDPEGKLFEEPEGVDKAARLPWDVGHGPLFDMPMDGPANLNALTQLDSIFLGAIDPALDGHLWNTEHQYSFRNLPDAMSRGVSTIQLVTATYGQLASQLSPGLGAFVRTDETVVNYTGK